jgi:hypothetical protein
MLMGNSSQVDISNTKLGQSFLFCIRRKYQQDKEDREQQFRGDSNSLDHMWLHLQYFHYYHHCHTMNQPHMCYNLPKFNRKEQFAMFQLDRQF